MNEGGTKYQCYSAGNEREGASMHTVLEEGRKEDAKSLRCNSILLFNQGHAPN